MCLATTSNTPKPFPPTNTSFPLLPHTPVAAVTSPIRFASCSTTFHGSDTLLQGPYAVVPAQHAWTQAPNPLKKETHLTLCSPVSCPSPRALSTMRDVNPGPFTRRASCPAMGLWKVASHAENGALSLTACKSRSPYFQ